MGSKLFIFIEGDDDERFFNRIIIPMFEKKYDKVQLWKYAQKKKFQNISIPQEHSSNECRLHLCSR